MAKRILLVDDEKIIVDIYRRALEEKGYEVICAYNGREGIEALIANPVDLVVLDLQMPVMSGDKFLKVKKSLPLLKDVKVVVMSSVLYRYKEIPRYDPRAGRIVRYDKIKEGFSRLGGRADKTANPEEDKLEMGEKPRAISRYNLLSENEEESESNFEQRLADAVVQKVTAAIGESGGEKQEKPCFTVVFERTTEIISGCLGVEKKKITAETAFKEDLGKSLADIANETLLIQEIEQGLGVRFSYEEVKWMKKVGDLVWGIEEKQARKRRMTGSYSDIWYRAAWRNLYEFCFNAKNDILFWIIGGSLLAFIVVIWLRHFTLK